MSEIDFESLWPTPEDPRDGKFMGMSKRETTLWHIRMFNETFSSKTHWEIFVDDVVDPIGETAVFAIRGVATRGASLSTAAFFRLVDFGYMTIDEFKMMAA